MRLYMPYVHNPESRECTEDFTDSTLKKEMVVLEPAIDALDSFNDGENGSRSQGLGKETRIYTWPTWLIAVKERMLEFYLDWTTQLFSTLVLDMIQVRDSRIFLILRR